MTISNIIISALLLNSFALFTIIIRPKIYGVELFKPMIWNFKLSLIPLFIQIANIIATLVIMYLSASTNSNWLMYLGYSTYIFFQLIWLAFLPNSGYLITELNLTHRLEDKKEVPIWYDIVSVLSLALSGIVNTLINIIFIQLTFIIFFDPLVFTKTHIDMLWISTLLITILVNIGIYLGRNIRFNTWDLLHPVSLIKKFIAHLQLPNEFKNFTLFVFFHTVLYMIIFVLFGFNTIFVIK